MGSPQVKGGVDIIGQAVQRHIAGVDGRQSPSAGRAEPLECVTRFLAGFCPVAQTHDPLV